MTVALDFLTFLYQVNRICEVYEEIRQKFRDFFNTAFGVVLLFL